MPHSRLTLPLLLAALAHSPTAAADDWLQNLQKGDWQKAIEGVVNDAAPAARTTPPRRPDARPAGERAREARAARRDAASAQRSAVKRRATAPADTGQRAERRRSRSR